MKKKEISEMTNGEILRQQLELLAEASKECEDSDIVTMTESMISIYSVLSSSGFSKESDSFIPEDSNGKHYGNSEKCKNHTCEGIGEKIVPDLRINVFGKNTLTYLYIDGVEIKHIKEIHFSKKSNEDPEIYVCGCFSDLELDLLKKFKKTTVKQEA